MTLEDFFTLAEMQNGLTTSARVEELINVIQVQNCITNNVGDAARQWSIAVSILASTQNSDCLSYFAHLNGLGFLNCWLQEVIKCCSDVEDDEELINTLLGALDKLPMNATKLITSGIFTTVEKLVCHKNVNIMEKAQLLTNKWKFNDDGCQELEKGSSCSKPSSDAASIEVQPAVEEEDRDKGKCRIESDRTKNPQIICDGDIQLGDGNIVKGFTCNQTLLQTTLASDAGHENLSVPQFSSVPFSSGLNGDEASNMSSGNDIKSDSKEGKSTLSNNEALHRCASVDALCQEYLKTAKEQKSGESGSTDLLHLPTHGSSRKDDTLEYTSDVERCNEPTLKACEGDVGFVNETSGVKVAQEIKNHSDLDLEVGEIDALEIARQVAIQVEREVADYREELCSSTDMDSNEMIIDSPGTEPIKHGHCIPDEENGNLSVPVDGNCEFGSSSKEKSQVVEHVAISSSKQETPNGATINNESDSRAEAVNFDFDLNKDACNEVIDDTVNPVNSISIVNLSAPIATFASKVAPGFLNAPPHFEGEFGWRDCAASSAFRPASPQTIMLEKEEWDSKHKAKVIGIDLNAFASEAFVTMDRNNSVSEVLSLRTERRKLDLNCNGGEEEEVTLSHSSFIEHHYRNGDLSLFLTSSSPQPSPPPRQSSCINFDLNDNMFLSDVLVSRNVFESSPDDPSGTVLGSTYSLEKRIHSNQSHMGSGLCFDTTFADMPELTYSHQIPHPNFGYIGATTRPASPFQPATYSYTELPHLYSPAGTTVSAASVTRPFLTSIPSTSSSSNGPCLDLNFGIGGSREERNLMHPFVLSPYSLTDEQGTSGSLLKRKEPDCGWEPHNFDYKHLKTWL